MTTLTERLAYKETRKIVLLEVTAGEWLRFWTAAGGGYGNTWYAATTNRIVGCKENGAAYTSRSSIALVDANAGSYYWDQANGRVYVHCVASVSPYTKTIQGTAAFYFADMKGRIYNGIYYEPRIVSLPTLSMRIEKMFGDPGQLGAGAVSLANNDGYFDTLSSLQWDAGTATLKMGAADPLWADPVDPNIGDGFNAVDATEGLIGEDTTEGLQAPATTRPPVYTLCDYADFDTLGSWRVTGWNKKDTEFSLTLEEKKGVLKKKIPLTLYDRTTYPNMEDSKVGEPIQIAYGTIYDVRPVCIDVAARQFKVAGHAIKEFIGVRVQAPSEGDSKGAWYEKSFASRDEATGTFTLAGADWDMKAEVAVDFKGKKNADGTLMDNAADVVEDLLTVVLEEPAASLVASVFTASYNRLYIGTDADGEPVSACAVSRYIAEEVDAADVISEINAVVGSYLFSDFEGKYRYKVFDPVPGNSAMLFEEGDIKSFEEITDATEIISSVCAEYQYRAQQNYPQVYSYARPQSQYLQGANSAVIKTLEELPLDKLSDAQYVAQRTAAMEGERQRTYKAKLSHRAWSLLPGDFVRIVYDRHGINAVFEVLETKRNLVSTLWVDVVLGNLHGLGDGILFLTDDSPTFPASLGGGACGTWSSAWTDAQKAWARQNVGYITDDNGFADPTDPDSYLAGIIV